MTRLVILGRVISTGAAWAEVTIKDLRIMGRALGLIDKSLVAGVTPGAAWGPGKLAAAAAAVDTLPAETGKPAALLRRNAEPNEGWPAFLAYGAIADDP